MKFLLVRINKEGEMINKKLLGQSLQDSSNVKHDRPDTCELIQLESVYLRREKTSGIARILTMVEKGDSNPRDRFSGRA